MCTFCAISSYQHLIIIDPTKLEVNLVLYILKNVPKPTVVQFEQLVNLYELQKSHFAVYLGHGRSFILQ